MNYLNSDIAIIGMSALFPAAKDLSTFWENILNKVDAIREAPPGWTNSFLPNSNKPYKGGFLGELAQFNPVEFGIMPNSLEGGDPDHFLALKLAKDALKDSGYSDRAFNREKTGIILGRGTYINRGLVTALQHSTVTDQTLTLLSQLNPNLDQETLSSIGEELKSSLPPLVAELIPTLVPNIVTGRIANRLDLMGPNYLTDAACSSALIAVELAMNELRSDRCDLMLAGGVQAATPAPIHILFDLLGALAPDKIRPFDAEGQGTLLSEGVGFLVLKRVTDAERDGDRIYAVLKSVGTSSDGKALGLLAPRLEGEVMALKRAYRDTIDPSTVSLIEAHATGIPLGDRTEIQSLTQVFGTRQGGLPYCAIGSVKSAIGHCIPAAGVASLIKIALALYYKVLPPMICDRVNPDLEIEKTPFYINNQTRPWIHGNSTIPRRAGIDAFGFGGINAHAILEEYKPLEAIPISSSHPQKLLINSPFQPSAINNFPTEVFTFSGNTKEDLIAAIQILQTQIENPNLNFANLAYTQFKLTKSNPHRLAIIAKDVSDLKTKIHSTLDKIHDPKRTKLQTRNGIYYASEKITGKTALLFPGEGSQYPNMFADLCLYFPLIRDWFDFSDETFTGIWEHPPSSFIFPPPTGLTTAEKDFIEQELYTVDVATEAVGTASFAMYDLLKQFGVIGDVMVGHSTGEHTAIIASGVIKVNSREHLMKIKRHLNQIHRDLVAKDSIPKGALLTVGAFDREFLDKLISNSNLYLAMDNCPHQVILFGSETDIEIAAEQLKSSGAICTKLPFDRAYHTPLAEGVASALNAYYDAVELGKGDIQLYSCATCDRFPDDPEGIKNLGIKQWYSRVQFREAIEKLYAEGFRNFIEVGPSSNLTAFIDDSLRSREYVAIASNHQRKSGLEQLQTLLARLFVNGFPINFSPLYNHRQLTEIDNTTISTPSKTTRVLDLTLPVMQLKSEFIQSIQDKLSPTPTIELPAITQPPEETPTPVIPPHQLTPTDESTRLAIVSAHFELMQEFLASQGRVASALFSPPDTDS